MTPKEKAKTLLHLFRNQNNNLECALLCVNEIISANPHSNPLNTNVHSTMAYWLEVKKELQNNHPKSIKQYKK